MYLRNAINHIAITLRWLAVNFTCRSGLVQVFPGSTDNK